jgi:putative Mg2+ transporter-C (MgtC) family protein
LRTFPLVGIASCAFTLIGEASMKDPDAMGRVLQGVVTGIGFIGGGAILKEGGTVRGTATAASVWATGAIGACSALGLYDIAIVVSVVTFVTLRLLTPLKSEREKEIQR